MTGDELELKIIGYRPRRRAVVRFTTGGNTFYIKAIRAKLFDDVLFRHRMLTAASGPRRAAAERQAINAPMQGTAADLIKKAMIAVQAALAGRQSAIVMQVHDELVLEVPEAEAAWAREQVPRLMAGVAELKVPLLAEIGAGGNWEEAH